MTLTADGWFTFAERDPGPLSKTNGGINTIRGVVPHSAEGYAPLLMQLVHDPSRRASWFASNLKNGRFIQHYPVYAQTWTSGAGYPNNNFVAWENEGVEGQPFTPQQTTNCVKVIRALSELGKWTPSRPRSPIDRTATCYEHRECVRFGAASTACPSGRVPWDEILRQLGTEDEMKSFLAWCGEESKVYFVGPGGAAWIPGSGGGPGPVFAELEKAFGKMTVSLSAAAIKAIGVVK